MFNINIHCIVFGVNILLNKRSILSIEENELAFPKLSLKSEDIHQINQTIISFLKTYIFVNDLVLIPQIISLNCETFNTETNTLDMVFGFIVDYNSSIDSSKVYWIDFDPMVEHRLSPIIFETIQKLT